MAPPSPSLPCATSAKTTTTEPMNPDQGPVAIDHLHVVMVAISWTPDVNANLALHDVGASYGVRKLRSDAPHWSFNGR